MYNEIALEMFKREPNCTEVILHPLLRVLEVNAKTLPLVLENGYNLNKLTTLYLFFDINRCVPLVPQFLSFVGSLSYLTHLKVSAYFLTYSDLPNRRPGTNKREYRVAILSRFV